MNVTAKDTMVVKESLGVSDQIELRAANKTMALRTKPGNERSNLRNWPRSGPININTVERANNGARPFGANMATGNIKNIPALRTYFGVK